MLQVVRSTLCPVCGFDLWFEPWHGDSASDEICPCCGMQFGYYDAAPGGEPARQAIYEKWRAEWIAEGMPWRDSEPAPPEFDPEAQLTRLLGQAPS